MPLHDLLCQTCEATEVNVYVPMEDAMTFVQTCKCGGPMEFDFRNRTISKRTRSQKFQEFTLHHTTRLDGTREGREIHSLHDIRRFEREHQAEGVCVEAFSYDSEQHIPDPQSQAPPQRMTEDQKRDFVEKYRAMDIKSTQTAKDYE